MQLLLLGCLAVANAGCLAVAAVGAAGAGVATDAYIKGRYSQDSPATFKNSYYSVIASLDELKHPAQSQENDGACGLRSSKKPEEERNPVHLTAEPPPTGEEGNVTRTGDPGGRLGDQIGSDRILA